MTALDHLEKLMAAGWLSVKGENMSELCCHYCKSDAYSVVGVVGLKTNHATDCPWIAAQKFKEELFDLTQGIIPALSNNQATHKSSSTCHD